MLSKSSFQNERIDLIIGSWAKMWQRVQIVLYFREISGQGFIGWSEGRKNVEEIEFVQKAMMWTVIVSKRKK